MDETGLARVKVLIQACRDHLAAHNYSPRTLDTYGENWRHFLDYLRQEDAADIPAVTRDALRRYQMHVYNGRNKAGNPLSVWTQNGRLVAVKVLFQYLAKEGHILADPSVVIELPRCVQGLPRGILSPAHIRRLLAAPDGNTPLGLRDRAILEVLYATGIRNQELANLTIHDVNLAAGEVRVRAGKGGRDRLLPLGEIAAHYVQQYLAAGRPRFLKLWQRRLAAAAPGNARLMLERESDLLFLGNKGKKLWDQVVAHVVARHARAAGLKVHLTPHSLRHTCATHMLQGGASVRHVQEMLGHKTIRTTQIYTHVAIDDLKAVHRRSHPRERPAS
jgi:integrase/recombinase XerD